MKHAHTTTKTISRHEINLHHLNSYFSENYSGKAALVFWNTFGRLLVVEQPSNSPTGVAQVWSESPYGLCKVHTNTETELSCNQLIYMTENGTGTQMVPVSRFVGPNNAWESVGQRPSLFMHIIWGERVLLTDLTGSLFDLLAKLATNFSSTLSLRNWHATHLHCEFCELLA